MTWNRGENQEPNPRPSIIRRFDVDGATFGVGRHADGIHVEMMRLQEDGTWEYCDDLQSDAAEAAWEAIIEEMRSAGTLQV